MIDLLIFALRMALVAALYAFLVLVMRSATHALRTPSATAAADESAFGLRLVVVDAGGSDLAPGQVIAVAHDVVLGRAARVDVIVADSAVSSEHARLSRVGRAWVVTDLGSTNGTRVNETPIAGQHPLAHGDLLGLGTVRLKVMAPQS